MVYVVPADGLGHGLRYQWYGSLPSLLLTPTLPGQKYWSTLLPRVLLASAALQIGMTCPFGGPPATFAASPLC